MDLGDDSKAFSVIFFDSEFDVFTLFLHFFFYSGFRKYSSFNLFAFLFILSFTNYLLLSLWVWLFDLWFDFKCFLFLLILLSYFATSKGDWMFFSVFILSRSLVIFVNDFFFSLSFRPFIMVLWELWSIFYRLFPPTFFFLLFSKCNSGIFIFVCSVSTGSYLPSFNGLIGGLSRNLIPFLLGVRRNPPASVYVSFVVSWYSSKFVDRSML